MEKLNRRGGRLLLIGMGAVFAAGATAAATDEQSSRLRVTNQCSYPLWIQQDYNYSTADPVVVRIPSKGHYDYSIPDAGLASTRFWPKAQCNEYGYDCAIGESVGVPDAQAAGRQTTQTVYDPDINSKFEATWGCVLKDSANCAVNPSSSSGAKLDDWTWWDGSAVDGFTFSYKIVVKGENTQCYDQHSGKLIDKPGVDCSGLDPAKAPGSADLSSDHAYPTINGVNVTAVDLRYRAFTDESKVVGSFSPCSKLTSGQWEGWSTKLGGLTPTSDQARLYCCPTQDGASWSVSPQACHQGPAAGSSYDTAVHQTMKCDAYTYAYDDAKGLAKCDGEAKFEVVLCPGGSDLPLPAAPRQPATFCDPNVSPAQMCPAITEGGQPVACPQCGADACPCPQPADG